MSGEKHGDLGPWKGDKIRGNIGVNIWNNSQRRGHILTIIGQEYQVERKWVKAEVWAHSGNSPDGVGIRPGVVE